MAKIYYNLVANGYYTIDQVPRIWRDAVQALLDADNEFSDNDNA